MEPNSCFTEKRRIRGKDILRMDGLLPPTRRLPVCNAITSTSYKKKEKKWSIGGIFKRISSMRDDDSSSNEEEIVYCKREPRKPPKINKQLDNIVLHPVKTNSERQTKSNNLLTETNIEKSMESLNVHVDSVHSRSSDGSLEGMGRKIRKNKMKARVEAKRDQMCPNSSSDEDSRVSNNSLTKSQLEDHHSQNICKTNSYNRRTRAARTERYIKRLFKEETSIDDGNQINCKRDSSECFNEGQHIVIVNSNDMSRQIKHSRQSTTMMQSNDQVPIHKSVVLSSPNINTDMNQNSFYEKNTAVGRWVEQESNNCFTLSSVRDIDRQKDHIMEQRSKPRSSNPPDPPPRDPRRVPTYACHSFPFNGRSQKKRLFNGYANTYMDPKFDCIDEFDKINIFPREYVNNKYTSMCNRSNEIEHNPCRSLQMDELEASKCRRKNNRNNQLSLNVNEYDQSVKQIQLSMNCEQNGIYGRISARNTRSSNERSYLTNNDGNEMNIEEKNKKTKKMDEEAALERKQSSKNLEEAIFELEAIYNSLRLGDEDLLDRAERRSMEEFSLRHGQPEDKLVKPDSCDSPDRSKDDMAYRRMHPVERPTFLSDIIGQSSLSNISYLIASPVLSRRDNVFDETKTPIGITRRDEPDVTKDDVVFRSIHHANNTLKVIEPQPPFGIPLGPVTTATESDYLHTVPNKSNPPRSLYIPQCEPDVVTDDLAFRTLRKDSTTTPTKNNVDNLIESFNEFPTKKKRAVRSLSANLYGLINQERIHLHRQPSLCEIKDDVENIDSNRKSIEKLDYFRRVVSDGELSDQGNTKWYGEKYTKNNFDINGNHHDSGPCRKMLRVYVSPSTTMQWSDKNSNNREDTPTSTFFSATRRTSSVDINQDSWKPTRNDSLTGKDNTDSDFTAYSRLCQDLVNIIKGTDEPDIKTNEQDEVIIEAKNSIRENKVEIEPLITELRNELLDNTLQERSNDFKRKETNETEECIDSKLDERNIFEIEDDKLDYYLRMANENVKMIAEAFSSVADHIWDGLDVVPGDDSSSHLRTDSDNTRETSTRSSSLLVEGDEKTKDEMSTSSKNEDLVTISVASDVSKEKLDVPNLKKNNVRYPSEIEIDLNRAVEDLQIAAASLNGSVQEMKELEIQLARLGEGCMAIDVEDEINNKNEQEKEEKGEEEEEEKEKEKEKEKEEEKKEEKDKLKLFIVEKKNVIFESNIEQGEGGGGAKKNVEQECKMLEPIETEDDSRPIAVREGEKNVWEIDLKTYENYFARPIEIRVPYVTNIITITITEYSMVLLACFLALLLAIVAAS
ncbi:PREDICTED: MATH and LRR domain-containing protein PFE0570w-like isoform X2 [Polistes canadensis]|uniref:MATH and LRR domain-containing protein PFE0570w-like isoform X2 n=1 Tax=Polistes canadensis TaxID=91411 RepID=UPI000718F207|nr:PREDICTED: MATH and LRR domain-containing protein PFE0570w-like isoform X2 [Polistes canadensis]